MNVPIELILYNKDDEPIKTLKRSIVPWGVMKKAMSLMQALEELQAQDKLEAKKTRFEKFKAWFDFSKAENETEVSLRMLEEFIVEFFGNQCTVKDLEGADTLQLMAVLQSIMARANSSMMANPQKPQRTRHK